MADKTGAVQSKIENLDEKQVERDLGRSEAERTRQQDLNQGMDTGTTDTVRHGVNWGSADRRRTVSTRNSKETEPPKKSDIKDAEIEDRRNNREDDE
jgi:hypothetical protein